MSSVPQILSKLADVSLPVLIEKNPKDIAVVLADAKDIPKYEKLLTFANAIDGVSEFSQFAIELFTAGFIAIRTKNDSIF